MRKVVEVNYNFNIEVTEIIFKRFLGSLIISVV